MEENYKELNNFFKKIEKKWFKSKRNGPTGIGYTFESLLGREENTLPVADYNGIEIKTMRNFSKRNIHLFSANPDGDYLYPIERILDKLGYPSKKGPNYKVFTFCFSGKEYSQIGYFKKAKIEINEEKQKIDMIAKDSHNKTIQIDVSWSYDLIKAKIENKIKRLAIVRAYHKFLYEQEYFYYNSIEFLEIKNFETFIELIKEGIITITFILYIYENGEKLGRLNNHGIVFSINYKDIERLYNRVTISDD